jgi:cell division protein FtsI/penicillin-binding protein 2/cell division protein FtsW (lipid II flippase)
MKVSRAEIAARVQQRRADSQRVASSARTAELAGILAASLVIATGLVLVYGGKTHDAAEVEKNTLDLNQITGPQQLLPYLGMIPDAPDQEFVANRIADLVRHGQHFGNTGAIARLRVKEADLTRGLVSFPERMADAKKHANARREPSITLLTPTQFAQLKPSVRVRTLAGFRSQFLLWGLLFLAGFLVVHFFWTLRTFTGDKLMLPAIELLSGIGLILMVSLRDPLRDTLMFADFAQGVLWGCLALIVFSIPDYERQFGRLSWVPLLVALLLALALGIFGTGPGTSDAKVNLLFFQPVEVIRIFLVLFLAGYFAQNWDALRQLRQEHGRLAKWSKRFNIPRLDYLLPVLLGVAASLALFFLLSDLGPALIVGCLFLTLYSIARGRVLLAASGLAVIVLGFFIGFVTGHPHTVTERVQMWRSPWDNHVRGGGQLADSLWALSTGGASGTGLGLGDPESMPAAHTDLIVSAFGEQAGLIGILALYLLYAALVYRSVRIALNAPGTYSFFLVMGLALILAYQILLITGGLLGLIPLSGVVSPFLSFGRTSMVANFALFAIVLSVSSRVKKGDREANFGGATRALVLVLATLLVVVLVRFSLIQVAQADAILVRPSLVVQADGARRYQYNPRILEVSRDVPKGAILDRNGLPLATNDWAAIEKYRDDYQKLGVALDQTTSKLDRRHYPFGAPLFYLLGDPRNRLKAGAKNTAFQERASRVRLQGYDDVVEVEESRDPETGRLTARVKRDYRAVIPLLRHRYEPDNPAVKEILERPRDVRMSIDARLQMRVSEILKNHLAKLHKQKGAIVIMDPATGDLLASVSYPWPSQAQFESLKTSPQTPLPKEDLLDRARFGLYPPGSSFKIVTAIAALRKDPALARKQYNCERLTDGRIGAVVRKRAVHDDIKDTVPHGIVDLQKGVIVSCNAFFAQLGDHDVGSKELYETAAKLGISVAQPNNAKRLQQFLPQASYGQGEVVVSPFQMARVASTIANGGNAPEGRWVIDETNPRARQPEPILDTALANQIAAYMRGVVTSGTGRVVNSSPLPIAGKTGTAELGGDAVSHAWFIGFAPYNATKQIAFAILVENGQYGGSSAAPMAPEIVAAARELGLL